MPSPPETGSDTPVGHVDLEIWSGEGTPKIQGRVLGGAALHPGALYCGDLEWAGTPKILGTVPVKCLNQKKEEERSPLLPSLLSPPLSPPLSSPL